MRTARATLIIFVMGLAASALTFVVLNIAYPLPVDKLTPETSTVITDRNGQILMVFLTTDGKWRIHKTLDEISPQLIDLVIHYEDRWFYYHPGINPFSIVRALYQNIRAGEIISGGSTITMQLARMIERRERTIGAKLIEAFRALQIELRYSKDEIIEMYFNLAPYGGNIEGVGAAARLYFGKDSSELSLGEAALLTTIPNSPTKTRPDKYYQSAKKARDKVLTILHNRGYIKDDKYKEALLEPIPTGRVALPFEAPHLTRLLKTLYPAEPRIQSTINLNIQKLVENIMSKRVTRLRKLGISQAAVVVLDNENADVLAMVGSYKFFDDTYFGQVNGALAPRSPGSALKPFVYAIALDRGLVTPASLLADVPVQYGVYLPENYDGKFRGVVSMRDALIHSLNVPAVNLLAKLGRDGLYPFLKSAGISTLSKPESEYGLSMVLGGCEVNILELSTLYSMLARGGVYLPYRLTTDTPRATGKRLISTGAAYIISEILAELQRPDLPHCWEFATGMPKIAWKTGTSYGHRDAWSIGYNQKYTVGVWMGNFSGVGAADLVGAEVAAPLLFDIFNALPEAKDVAWFTRPSDVGEREVCSVSGMPKGHDCPSSKTDLYIKNVSPSKPCSIHVAYDIDDKTGHRLCSKCRAGKSYHRETFELWPAEVAFWLEKNGYSIKPVPIHNPHCAATQSGQGPVIQSPQADTEYIIRQGVPLEYQKIRLRASVSNDVRRLFWFVDGDLYWSGNSTEEVFYTPSPGTHTFICSDDLGRKSSVTLLIR